MEHVTVPVEVIIDRLVLPGIAARDAPTVVAAFRSHLIRMLSEPSAQPEDVLAAVGAGTGEGEGAERYGRQLAAAVARSVRRAGVT